MKIPSTSDHGETVKPGHPQVRQQDIGADSPDQIQAFFTVPGLADNADPPVVGDSVCQQVQYECGVVGQDNPDRARCVVIVMDRSTFTAAPFET